ncbi:MAG TPA: adenylate/guanylate cyclase domain-containing protein, partial [Actinomycetota bacterium]
AARTALDLAEEHHDRLQHAIGNGWFQRAVRLLDALPEGVAHGFLALARARGALEQDGDPDRALELASRALVIGARFGDRDLQAFGLSFQGLAHIAKAETDRGLALIDEAAVAAVGGELSPETTGIVYCLTIGVCRDLADYNRAGEWTEAAERWCARQSVPGFPGICRVHRAEIMRLRGALPEAEREARRSVEELKAFGKLWIAGSAYYEIGEIRLRIGDLDGAEEAFAEAHQLGHDPQPGLALLHLARGRADAARASIASALVEQQSPLMRARLLPARVEIALAAHDVTDAREAAEELGRIAGTFEAPMLDASAHEALGSVLTYEGDAAGGVAELRKAVRRWGEADQPFETAHARRCLAIAYRAAGDEASALLELRAAKAAFDQLGARLEAERCAEMIAAGEGRRVGRRVARTFMFTDIVGSTNLIGAMGDEAWEELTRWHHETLRSLIETHGGEVVHSTGDGFFATFADAATAATCAVAIQRRLAEHRTQHGFAPQVRIGLHAGEATTVAGDYAGLDVHEAARVGAIAEGSEILVTAATVAAEPIPFPTSDERTVTLKGIAEPVRVVAVDWRR